MGEGNLMEEYTENESGYLRRMRNIPFMYYIFSIIADYKAHIVKNSLFWIVFGIFVLINNN